MTTGRTSWNWPEVTAFAGCGFSGQLRGEERPDSDIDFLIQFEPGRSLLDQVGFGQDLEELLGRPVDVVAEGGISPYMAEDILREAVPL